MCVVFPCIVGSVACESGALRITKEIVHYATSAMKRFLTSVSLQHEPKASDVITLVKKTFFARVSYEILYHEVWNKKNYYCWKQCFTINVFMCCSESSRAIPQIYPIVMRLDIQKYRRVTNRKFEVKSYSQSQQPTTANIYYMEE